MKSDELDDEWKPTRIRFPKVDPTRMHDLFVDKTKTSLKPKSRHLVVVLKKQVIAGMTIPHGTTMEVDTSFQNSAGMVRVDGATINKMLKSLYIESLRTKKKNEDW